MKHDRRKQIADLVRQQQTITNAEIMSRFDISIETVRRDLESLEQQGFLRRVYGGAVAVGSLSNEPEYANRANTNYEAKTAIAREAAKFIGPQDAIYLGVGTTVQALVPHVKNIENITVFTNALRTAIELSEADNCTVILPGGQLRTKELTVSGFPAEDNFNHFNVDKAFIGIGGIDESGVTDFHVQEARLHRQLIENARQAIVLTDSGKLGMKAMVNVCPLKDVDVVITDSGAPKDVVDALKKAGVQVIIAKV